MKSKTHYNVIKLSREHGYTCVKWPDLPNEIEIIATDSKGSCEAFRHKTLPIEAWMWHPERESPYVEQDLLNLKRVLNND